VSAASAHASSADALAPLTPTPPTTVPSTRSVAADDAIGEPINGISLENYAELARDAQARGVTDEAGMIALAQERGWNRGGQDPSTSII
jgi:hypothetical protein